MREKEVEKKWKNLDRRSRIGEQASADDVSGHLHRSAEQMWRII